MAIYIEGQQRKRHNGLLKKTQIVFSYNTGEINVLYISGSQRMGRDLKLGRLKIFLGRLFF